MSVPYERPPCPLGCPPGDAPVLSATDRLHGRPGRFGVVRCRSCGLMRTSPRVAEHAIGAYYPPEYGPHHPAAAAASPPRPLRALRRRLNPFPLLPRLPPGRALEIGCGAGALLTSLRREGWQVRGIERSPRAAALATRLGHDVFCGRVEDAPAPDSPYDLIVGLMVLEHLYDPVQALRRLAGWAAPDAHLVVSVPNAASLERRLFGDAWYALQLPTHLTHFTPRTLARVLDAGGWRLERTIHQPNLNNALMSAAYRARDEGQPRLAERLQRATKSARTQRALKPLAMAAALIGQTGRMTAWARPIDAP